MIGTLHPLSLGLCWGTALLHCFRISRTRGLVSYDRLAAKEKETTALVEVASGTADAEVSRTVERRDAPTSARGTPYKYISGV